MTRAQSKLIPGTRPLLWAIGALFAAILPTTVLAQVVYTYDDTPGSPIALADNACGTPIERTFVVADSFTVNNIALGVRFTHPYRGDLRVVLVAPDNTTFTAINSVGDSDDNYNVMLSTNDEGFLDDGDIDPAAASVSFRRLVSVPGISFYSGNAAGTWRIRVCDNAGADLGTYDGARLVLRGPADSAPTHCGTSTSFEWGDTGDNNPFVSNTQNGVTVTQGTTSGQAPSDGNTGTSELSFRVHTGVLGGHAGHYFFSMNTTGDTELSIEWTDLEFSVPVRGLTFSGLDNDLAAYEDYFRVDGFNGTIPVPKRTTMANAQLSYAGDWVEADSSIGDGATGGNVTYYFTGPVTRVRVMYAQGDEPQSNSGNQWTGISDLSYCAFDFGDAPASYNTTFTGSSSAGARHTVGSNSLFMGTAPDAETDGVAGAAANSDDADENGSLTLPTEVLLPTPHFECGAYSTAAGEFCVSVDVTNNLASAAQLVGWVDFNFDGDFNDANERSIPRLGIGSGGAVDGTFTTGNIAAGTTGSRVLVWSGVTDDIQITESDTYLRLRLTTDATFFSDSSPQPNGAATDGEVEDHLLPAGTLPVTLAFVQSRIEGKGLDVRFTTVTETENAGFSIEAKGADGKLSPLHQGLVPSRSNNALEPSAYSFKLAEVPRSGQFYIVDHDVRGKRKAHGPFQVGATSGREPKVDNFDWSNIRSAIAQGKALGGGAIDAGKAKLWVSEPGFHRVTAADLAAAGINLNGTPVGQIAVTYRGQGVPRRVVPNDGVFGAGSYVDFLVTRDFSLYTQEFPYLLRNDGVGRVVIDSDRTVADTETPAWYWAESRYAPELSYNFGSPTADPWYAQSMFATPNQPAGFSTQLNVSDMAVATDFTAELSADLIGVTNFAGGGNDHHVRLEVEGQPYAEASFDGAVATSLVAHLPLLSNGALNVGVVTVGDTGFDFDLNYLDAMTLRYPRLPVAQDHRLQMDALQSSYSRFSETPSDTLSAATFLAGFEGPDFIAGFRVDGLQNGEVVAYVGRGDDWRWLEQTGEATGGSVMLPSETGSGYWVSNTSALLTARVETVAAPESITSGTADYLIITHPLFVDAVQPLVALQQSRGLTTRVVSVAQIYAQFGDHVPEPVAIQRYLDQVTGPMGVDYVLLVGGDTYDYKNFLGAGSVSLIPTQYVAVGDVVRFAPADALFADADRDGAPEFALGRLPVRNTQELNDLMAKIVNVTGTTPDHKLMLVAQASDDTGNYDEISDAFAGALPNAWSTSRVYVDELGASPARSALLAGLNTPISLLSYVGHSAPTQWSFDPLLTTGDVNASSGGMADLVVQWGCWNSYFVRPAANTLAHTFLLAPGRGAARFW
jgi:subtilisin-like proprotein convertase family protein